MIKQFTHIASLFCQLGRKFKVKRWCDFHTSSDHPLLFNSRFELSAPPGTTPSSADLLELSVMIFTATETINPSLYFPGWLCFVFLAVSVVAAQRAGSCPCCHSWMLMMKSSLACCFPYCQPMWQAMFLQRVCRHEARRSRPPPSPKNIKTANSEDEEHD